MGIVNRKEREKEELRNLILEAALELLRDKGYEQTSIRAIAEKIEYSPTTLYLYYKDKNALLYAMHERGFQILSALFIPLLAIADPFERLLEMGRTYVRFAVENPTLYDLMFLDMSVLDSLEEHKHWDEGQNAFSILVSNVKQSQAMRMLPEGDPEVLAYYIWSSLHGMVTLQLRHRCDEVISEQNRADILHKSLAMAEHVLRCLRQSPIT